MEDGLIDLNGKEMKEACLWLLEPFFWGGGGGGGGGVDDKTVGMGISVLSGSKHNKHVCLRRAELRCASKC